MISVDRTSSASRRPRTIVVRAAMLDRYSDMLSVRLCVSAPSGGSAVNGGVVKREHCPRLSVCLSGRPSVCIRGRESTGSSRVPRMRRALLRNLPASYSALNNARNPTSRQRLPRPERQAAEGRYSVDISLQCGPNTMLLGPRVTGFLPVTQAFAHSACHLGHHICCYL